MCVGVGFEISSTLREPKISQESVLIMKKKFQSRKRLSRKSNPNLWEKTLMKFMKNLWKIMTKVGMINDQVLLRS